MVAVAKFRSRILGYHTRDSCEISGSHGGEYEDGLLHCVVW
jgi:hypothetical protein